MDKDNFFVIQVQDGNSINHPLTYSNFLLLFPDCPVEEMPTNEIISPYGYEVFVHTKYQPGPYIKQEDGNWTNTWIIQSDA